jgi:hypothetical protein
VDELARAVRRGVKRARQRHLAPFDERLGHRGARPEPTPPDDRGARLRLQKDVEKTPGKEVNPADAATDQHHRPVGHGRQRADRRLASQVVVAARQDEQQIARGDDAPRREPRRRYRSGPAQRRDRGRVAVSA